MLTLFDVGVGVGSFFGRVVSGRVGAAALGVGGEREADDTKGPFSRAWFARSTCTNESKGGLESGPSVTRAGRDAARGPCWREVEEEVWERGNEEGARRPYYGASRSGAAAAAL